MDEAKIILIFISLNLILSFAHFVLLKFKDKTESKLDDNLFALVCKLEEVLEWLMCNRKK